MRAMNTILLSGVAVIGLTSIASAQTVVCTDAAAQAVCDKIAKEIDAKADPAASLSVTDEIRKGDFFVNHPDLSGPIVVRKTLKGYTAFAVSGVAVGPYNAVAVTDDGVAASLMSGAAAAPAAAYDAASLVADVEKAEPAAKSVAEKIAADLGAGGDPFGSLSLVDEVRAGDVVVGGLAHDLAIRKTLKGYSAFVLDGIKAPSGVAKADQALADKINGATQAAAAVPAAAAAAPAKAEPKYVAGMVLTGGTRLDSTGAQGIKDPFTAQPIKSLSNIRLDSVFGQMPVKHAFFWPYMSAKGFLNAKEVGQYKLSAEINTPNNQLFGYYCYPRISLIDGGSPLLLAGGEAVAAIPSDSVKNVVNRVEMSQPLEIDKPGMYEVDISVTCSLAEDGKWGQGWSYQSEKEAAQFFSPKAGAVKGGLSLLPVMMVKMQRPGEDGFSEIKGDEIVYDPASTSVSSGGIKVGQRKTLEELFPKAAEKIKSSKPGWYVDVVDAKLKSDDVEKTLFVPPSGWSMDEHVKKGLQEWGKGYVSTSKFYAKTKGTYTFAIAASNMAALSKPDYSPFVDKCSVGMFFTSDDGNDIVIPDEEKTVYTSREEKAASGPLGALWSGTVSLDPAIYMVRVTSDCAETIEGRKGKVDLAGKTEFRVMLKTPDDTGLRMAGDQDFRFDIAK